MIRKRASEAAIRVGADGAEWLVWRLGAETLLSGRMTASYSVEAALDQWLGRAERFGLKPRRVWLIAGVASCAHRRLQFPGMNAAVVEQVVPLAAQEELPLPLDQMRWTSMTHQIPGDESMTVDVVATPRSLFQNWENALRERRLDLADRIPEGPLLWHELAAMRGSEIDLLTVWGERRAVAIRGTEVGPSSLLAFVRGPGESWESLVPDLRRPFQMLETGKTILSIFASERLRKRILSLPDLIPDNSENQLNRDIFHGVPEDVSVAASLLALRRLRIEKRKPVVSFFSDSEAVRPTDELRKVATSLKIPYEKLAGVAVLLALILGLWWKAGEMTGRYADSNLDSLRSMRNHQTLLDNQLSALKDIAKYRADWGSVWLQLSQEIPEHTLLKDFSYGTGSGVRINGITENPNALKELDTILRKNAFFESVSIPKTEPADKKLSFQISAEFKADEVERYEVEDPFLIPKGLESKETEGKEGKGAKKAKKPTLSKVGERDAKGKGKS